MAMKSGTVKKNPYTVTVEGCLGKLRDEKVFPRQHWQQSELYKKAEVGALLRHLIKFLGTKCALNKT